jgi:hypothetical protein
MKFVKTSISKLNRKDFISYIPSRTPYLKLFGYVRIINGKKIIQSKNGVQMNVDPIHPLQPCNRYWKVEINKGIIERLT